MQVVSVGDGNVNCDDTHNCDHGTNGVLLLPESKNHWKAFNVHTLFLPEQAAAVTQQVSQSKVVATLLTVAKSGVGGTALMLMIFVCLGFVLLNMFGGSSEENKNAWENKPEREEEGIGSWEEAICEAQGARREAMEFLFKTGIIATQDLKLPYVNATYMEECVQIASQMLKERSQEAWVQSWELAQQTFADRLSKFYEGHTQDVMAAYEFSDGSWARAYRQSEGHRDRREGFELLLRLGIISPEEFANSLVTPKYIEERLSVAMNLLNQKPLSQWVDLCESTGQGNFRESVLACFSTQGGGANTPPRQQEWSPPERSSGHATLGLPPTSHAGRTDASPRLMPVVEEFAKRESPGDIADSAEGPSAPGTNTFSTGGVNNRNTDRVTKPVTLNPSRNSPRRADDRGTKSAAFHVIPVGNDAQRGVSPRGTASMPASLGGRMATQGQPPLGTVHWPSSEKALGSSGSSGFGAGRDSRSPRTTGSLSQGVASQSQPVKIMFSSNAISGSAWESRVTPPSSQKEM